MSEAYKHRAYIRAVKQHAPNAKHRRTSLHRKRALTTKPVERSHVPIKDRLRPMRSFGCVRTGQRLQEGVELAQAVATFSWLASGLRTSA